MTGGGQVEIRAEYFPHTDPRCTHWSGFSGRKVYLGRHNWWFLLLPARCRTQTQR